MALLAGLPILVLTSCAVLRLRAERRATLADTHAEGRSLAESGGVWRSLAESVGKAVGLAMEEAFEGQTVVVCYSKTPEPSTAHPDEQRFHEARVSSDADALTSLCESAGLTEERRALSLYGEEEASMKELIARVRALLRRADREVQAVDTLTFGQVQVDFIQGACMRDGEPLDLNAKELQMLRVLAEHRGEPVSREHFLDVVWDYHAHPTTRTVDNYIASLRKKLEVDPAEPTYILTVRGLGYRLVSGA